MSTLLRYAVFTSCLLAVSAGRGEDNGLDPEYDRLQGEWKIVELTDNGTSVPSDQCGGHGTHSWIGRLPSRCRARASSILRNRTSFSVKLAPQLN